MTEVMKARHSFAAQAVKSAWGGFDGVVTKRRRYDTKTEDVYRDRFADEDTALASARAVAAALAAIDPLTDESNRYT